MLVCHLLMAGVVKLPNEARGAPEPDVPTPPESRPTSPPVEARSVADPRRMLSDVAYEFTKERILDGAIGRGEWIRVEDIAAKLGMSRQPVMDALRRLSIESIIEIVPQVGSRVAVTDPREIADFFRFFATTEGLTAEFAASRANAAETSELRRIHREIAALAESKAPQMKLARRYRLLNRAFHSQIHSMSHSKIVSDIGASNWDRSDFFIAVASPGDLVFARRIKIAHAEHGQILAAIAKGDAKGAAAAMGAHLLAFGRSAVGANIPEDE